jgi:hypothetical protein
MTYPFYAVTSICISPNSSTRISVSIVKLEESGAETSTFERHEYSKDQFDPFAQMSRAQVAVLIAGQYNTTVDNVRV